MKNNVLIGIRTAAFLILVEEFSRLGYLKQINLSEDGNVRCKTNSCLLFFFVVSFFGIFSAWASDKVLIFTYSFNRPDFIEIQQKTFQKFLLDDYEFVVFNDAKDPSLSGEIHKTCERLNIRCIDMPQHLHTAKEPSYRNARIVNYSLNQMGFDYDGIVALFDSDLFLVKEFSIKDYMQNYPLAGLYQERSSGSTKVDYLWVGIAFLDMRWLPDKKTINFGLGKVKRIQTDTGGYTHYYLSKHRNVPVRYINLNYTKQAHEILKSCSCIECKGGGYPCEQAIYNAKSYGKYGDEQIQFIYSSGADNSEFFLDSHFFHYRAGSNWDHQSGSYHANKTRSFNEYIRSILED
jgi:hypothetical protein